MAARVPERFIGADWRQGVRMFSHPDDVVVVVAGGAGRHSCIIPLVRLHEVGHGTDHRRDGGGAVGLFG